MKGAALRGQLRKSTGPAAACRVLQQSDFLLTSVSSVVVEVLERVVAAGAGAGVQGAAECSCTEGRAWG